MRIAIHQPNFFPHKAFFDKIAMADAFVFLNHCQFEKNGYQNRFEMGGKWNTMQVSSKTESIWNKQYLNVTDDWSKIMGKQRISIQHLFKPPLTRGLAETNMKIITTICEILSIKTHIYMDFPTTKTGTERLVEICKHLKADEYISGPSGSNYLDPILFEKAGINIIFQAQTKSIPILEYI